ncbi:MarR family winged helix-turn-helix transcriptional regulator [Isoptericola jiangsuensis]|uniref:MarR family winged helix-turn-helix transcriptional regulator n=1 Tax=Isoptericola jiangsuensis TaxID=548579 RepID=UPI003AB0B9B4
MSEDAPSAYWYADTDAEPRRLLEALRTFRRADEEMRLRASRDMDMNLTDLRALRHVIARGQHDDAVTPRALAARLGISSASTTKLLDRLCASGHLERRPHPVDRRSVVVVATDAAHHEVRDRLTRMHARMLAIAEAVPRPAGTPSRSSCSPWPPSSAASTTRRPAASPRTLRAREPRRRRTPVD